MNHITHFDISYEDNDGDSDGDGDDEDDNYDGGSEDEDDDEDDDDDDDDDSSEDHIPGPEGGGRSLKGGGLRQISTNSAPGTVMYSGNKVQKVQCISSVFPCARCAKSVQTVHMEQFTAVL